MRKSVLCCYVVLLLAANSLQAATKKVIVISIDGLRGITLASLSTRGLHTPNLNEFAQGGAAHRRNPRHPHNRRHLTAAA